MGAWKIVEDVPQETTAPFKAWSGTKTSSVKIASTRTIALSVWRCLGCGALACGATGAQPGDCLFAGCRYARTSQN